MKHIITSLVLISILFGGLHANDLAGQSAFILRQAMGARPFGMAEVFTAIADDPSAIYYNPAGLANVNERQADLMYWKGIDDQAYLSVSFADNIESIGNIGAGFLYYSGGTIEINFTDGTSEERNAQQDHVFYGAYGKQVLPWLSAGITAKAYFSKLVNEYSASAYAIDIGVLYDVKGINIAHCAQNIGTKLKYYEAEEKLPLVFRNGLSYNYIIDDMNNIIFGCDIIYRNQPLKTHIGAEYNYRNMLSLRTGYKIGYDLDSISLGAGFRKDKFMFDYGIGFMSEIGPTHRVSFGMQF